MRSVNNTTPALHRVFSSFISKTTLTVFTLLASASLNVMADHAVSIPTTGLCPADTVGATLNCTSNDVTIALVTAEDAGTVCIHGETAILNLNTQVEINAASERDDVAAWIPTTTELGKNMLLTSGSGGPASCQSKGFHFPITADDSATVLVEDLDGDACGDVNGINDVFTRPFTDAEVACDGTVGGAQVDAVVSWHLSGNDPVCNVHQDYGNFKKSKCSNTTSFVDLIVVGKLTVCKAAAADQNFGFTIESGVVWEDGTGADEVPTVAAAQFNLNAVGGPQCETFDVLTAQGNELNEVTITETNIPEGFGVSDISCINNADGGAPAAFTDNGEGFTIGLTEGNLGEEFGVPGQPDVTCTVTNTEGGSITIIKDAVPNHTQNFNFTGTGPEAFNEAFNLDDDGNGGLPNSMTFDNLAAGVHTFAENLVTANAAGWDLTGIQCTADQGSDVMLSLQGGDADIDLSQSGEVICTFTNTQRGMIRVEKVTFPAGGSGFDFSGDLNGTIDDGGVLEAEVIPGAYSVTEGAEAGWDLDSIVCTDDNSTGDTGTGIASFNVEAGEIVTCVFTNYQRGNIVVNKTAEGGDDTFNFNLWLDGVDTGTDNAFGTTAGSGSGGFSDLPASAVVGDQNYGVTEDVPAGWELIDVACTDVAGAPVDPADFTLEPGATITCEFLDWKNAHITIHKEAFGPDDTFCFIVTGPLLEPEQNCVGTSNNEGEIMLQTITSTILGFGTWNIVEEGPEQPWVLAGQSCDDGQDPAEFELEPGDDVTCTFVNVLPVPVPVNNMLALLMMVLMVLATGWYFRPAAMRKM